MAIDRSKFQGAKMSTLKGVQKDAKENQKSFGSSSSRVDFHTIDEGKNVFRIMPPHPEDKIGASYLPFRTTMLKCEVDVYKDGEKTGKTEVKNKKIFIGTQHGGLPKDPIELYIDYVRKYANDAIDDKEERRKFLAPITGWRDKAGAWHWGIIPNTSYVAYAIKDGKLGRLELYEAWIKEMDKISINSQENSNDVILVDPFSDPDEGCPLIITKGKDDKGKMTTSISKDEPSRIKRESWDAFFERVRVTDEQLAELEEKDPLSSLYGRDVYTRRDFELALDGLKRFDDENKFGIFDNDEFMSELDEIDALVKEAPKDKEDEVEKVLKQAAERPVHEKEKETVIEQSKHEEESFEMSIPEMKGELKKIVKRKFGEEYVDQIPSDKLQIVKWYNMIEEGENLPIKIKSVEEKQPEKPVDTPKEVNPSVGEDKLANDIELLRARRRGLAK